MLYHASPQSGLKTLVPHESTHGKEYVYALNNRFTALLFGAPSDDFDLLVDESAGRTVIYECYPGALKAIYSGKSCSVYEVGEDGFLAGQTGWDAELVCEHSVPVSAEERIEDLYDEITSAIQSGTCIFHPYSKEPDYQSHLREELLSRIHIFGITGAQMDADPRFRLYFSELLAR